METNRPKVSVIVPVFKAEKFIERCCISLFEQTLEELEYIFVDDCSPDCSVEIIHNVLERYPHRKSQVVFLTHSPNRGVSFSRQQGLDAATGEYVTHCDSDDWIDKNAYLECYEKAIREQADVVCFGYNVVLCNGKKEAVSYPSSDYFATLNFNISPINGALWNKLVKLELIREHDIKFPSEINWGEDFCFITEVLLCSAKTICLRACFYFYMQNANSITHKISPKICDELVRVAQEVETFLLNNHLLPQYEDQLGYLQIQCKQYFLMFPETRDIEKWLKLFPKSSRNLCSYPVPLYFKISGKLAIWGLKPLALLILRLRDTISNIKSK